jgi:hypothetical protein
MDPRKYFNVPMEIIPWTHSNTSIDQWKSFHASMEIIPCTPGNHSKDIWKSLGDNGNKGYGNYNLH